MVQGIPGWTPDLERSFKEVVFRFLEEVQSTKAALYLLAPDGTYALVTQYGFGRRDLLAAEHHATDPLGLHVRELRVDPRAFNDPREIPEIAGYLEGAGTARLLLVPLYGDSRVIGFVDVRDKGRKQSFDDRDLNAAREIASSLLRLICQVDLYPGVGAPPTAAVSEEAAEAIVIERHQRCEAALDADGIASVHEEAKDFVRRGMVAATAVTVVVGDTASTVVIMADGGEELDSSALRRHQSEALRAERASIPDAGDWIMEVRHVRSPEATARAQQIASAVAARNQDWSLVISTLAGMGSPTPQRVLASLWRAVEMGRELSGLRHTRRRAAWQLLHPAAREIAPLRTHSLAVSRLCWDLARQLGLDARTREDAAVVGLVHDVGMLEIDYDRLYRHPSPAADERLQYQLHAGAGERMMIAAGLEDIAPAVGHHHERWDGKGYPDRLAGDAIPLLARVAHVCEVFDVLTNAVSYRSAVSTEHALALIQAASGQQFDPDMVRALVRTIE